MDSTTKPHSALFDVFLRLRPSFASNAERFLDIETREHECPTHITIRPPVNDYRKRAIEKFGFTQVFQEDASQLELFKSTGLPEVIEGVLGKDRAGGRDGLLATLGVTGSGKSHTILGSRSQRGLTQMSLDVLYQTLAGQIADAADDDNVLRSISATDNSEAQMMSAGTFLDLTYGDGLASSRLSRATSRGATPMMDASFISIPGASSKKHLPRLSAIPRFPNMENISIEGDTTSQFAIVVSMYEVYNDRIFDLLTSSVSAKTAIQKRRGLLFKSTEASPDRKVVAGLRKVICSNLEEALLVLETGLAERRVAGTGSNAASSRSHGFFCVEVKKRPERSPPLTAWKSSTLTIVDLAGSERARVAKTTGSTLAEAGKINESLMYLGQCMQLQSDNADLSKPLSIVPFRQCKLTELLFSNSFPSSNMASRTTQHKQPQKSIMIVTADPHGDFNATSQILRYSALAREVTVPRIPSVTSSIISAPSVQQNQVNRSAGRTSPTQLQDLDAAIAEIARLRSELEVARMQAEQELHRRREAEHHWAAAAERCSEIEAEVREEMWSEFEERLEEESRRWRETREEEEERRDDVLDRKMEILQRGLEVKVYEDQENECDRLGELEQENLSLKARLANAEREKGLRTPSRKVKVLKQRNWEGSACGLEGTP